LVLEAGRSITCLAIIVRKMHVQLLERLVYLLEHQWEPGQLVAMGKIGISVRDAGSLLRRIHTHALIAMQ
jgi:hypothetical protein